MIVIRSLHRGTISVSKKRRKLANKIKKNTRKDLNNILITRLKQRHYSMKENQREKRSFIVNCR